MRLPIGCGATIWIISIPAGGYYQRGWEKMRWETWKADEVITVPWSSRIIDTRRLSSIEVVRPVASWIKLNIPHGLESLESGMQF